MTAIPTPIVRHPPIVLLVGLRDEVARKCAKAVEPLPTMRAAGVTTALERLPIVRPLVVVVSEEMPTDEAKTLAERAADVLAEFVRVGSAADAATIESSLKKAAADAEARRG